MRIAYRGAALVTSKGILWNTSLHIDTWRWRILPFETQTRQTVDAEGMYFYPGLINAHDHLELNHYPRTKFRERYENASQWAQDVSAQLTSEPYANLQKFSLQDRCLIGGLKNLFSGVTTVAHHNPLYRPLKARWFPVHVVRHYGWAHSFYLWDMAQIQESYRKTKRGAWLIHLAEGLDRMATQEWAQLKQINCVSDKTVLIHGVGLENVEEIAEQCGGLIWCPSTNFYLLGETAQVREWFTAGKLALGSDSRLTADGDLLDELRAAAKTGQLTQPELFSIVTTTAAKILKLDQVGDLQPGNLVDVLALPVSLDSDPYRALLKAKRSDVQWVMRGGQIIWRRDNQNANCRLDGVSYWMEPRLLLQVKNCQIKEPGFEVMA